MAFVHQTVYKIQGKVIGHWNIFTQSWCHMEPVSQVEHLLIKQSSICKTKSLDHEMQVTLTHVWRSILPSYGVSIPSTTFIHQIVQAFKRALLFLLFLVFPTFFCIPTFPYFFLKMPYYPYFLVQKCLKWPKIVIFFLACSKFVKIGST